VRQPRVWLILAAAAVVVAIAIGGALLWFTRPAPAPPPPPPESTNPIPAENQQPGSDGWRLPRLGYQLATDVGGQIKGYASAPSTNQGGSLTLYVSASPAQSAAIDVYRMGWYAGQGGRLMEHIEQVAVAQQGACSVDQTTGLIACPWTPTYTRPGPTHWPGDGAAAANSDPCGSASHG
jgi:N,N-dimethylformamidase beta subunit-like, C-terminal